MQGLIGVIIGLLIGGVLLELPGAFIGAVVGFLVGKVYSLSRLIESQQAALDVLKNDHQVILKKLSSSPSESTTVDQITEPRRDSDDSEKITPLSEHLPELNEEFTLDLDVLDAVSVTATPHRNKSASQAPQGRHTDAVGNNLEDSPLPTLLSRIIAKTNLVTRVGIIVLFFGVAFLLKYTAENIFVTIEMRLSLIALGGAILFFLGWKLRSARPDYAVLLQGAASGVWYLTTYASLSLYEVIPATVGFSLMLFVSVFTVAVAVMQDSKALAVFAITGGFLAPILASTGSGSHVMLFSYYAVLNVGIVSIIWFKAWRSLALLGFIFTFVIGVAWGVTRYSPQHFSSTEPFLIIFMLFYIAVVMLFALRKQWAHSSVLDGPLVFGTPVIGFALQSQLVQNFSNGMAWSALLFGLFYLGIVYLWRKMLAVRSPILKESFLMIGIVLVSLAIPYAFDHDVTALLWAFEGAGGLWLAVRQRRLWGCILALLAQLGAGVAWMWNAPSSGEYLFANADYMGAVLIALVALYSSWLMTSQRKEMQSGPLHLCALVWGLCWWLGAAAWQIHAHLDVSFYPAASVLFITVSAVLLQYVRNKLQWMELTSILVGVLPIVLSIGLFSFNVVDKPSESLGYIAWPTVILCLYWLYNKAKIFKEELTQLEIYWHGATFLLAVGLASWEILWQVRDISLLDSWGLIGAGVASFGAAWLVITIRFWRAELDAVYREGLLGLLFSGLLLNILLCNLIKPNLMPLSYVPLFNPLDLWQLAVLASIALWWRKKPFSIVATSPAKIGWSVLGVTLFFYINALLFRVIHVSVGIPFNIGDLFNSDLVQTCLSILWTVMGLVLFVAIKRWPKRELWLVGVAIFGVVVTKLFLVDLANTGTVERIISFMGVGLLLLIVGYLVPIPEKEKQNEVVT